MNNKFKVNIFFGSLPLSLVGSGVDFGVWHLCVYRLIGYSIPFFSWNFNNTLKSIACTAHTHTRRFNNKV